MRLLTLFLLVALVLGARGYLIRVPTATTPALQPKIAPVGWVHLQKLILPLFENICEESTNPIIVKLSQNFKLDTMNEDYVKPDFIQNLLDLKSGKGLLPKNEIFTEYKTDHLNEMKVVYELLYNANNFDTFYKAACWARQNINCGLFIDALYSAILNRKDTGNIFIPAPYEILPNYFIRKDFIIKASSLFSEADITQYDYIRNDGNSYILDVNYTTQVYDEMEESKLVYFYEDIGLNSYYYLTKLKMCTWINSNPKNNRYGEYLYSMVKQLMARYNLERYSNGLPEIESVNWDNLNIIPYYDPMLIYSNGNDFSRRIFNQLENTDTLTLLKSIENNIATVVTHMREGGFSKSEILNHLMGILITSDKSYENLALQILNEDTTIHNSPPSVLGHYMTILRDPAYWAINKKIVDLVDTALKVLPGYTRDELYFPGVEILNVEVKKMMTNFDNFVFDVTDALKTSEDDTKFKVKISQSRLNHKPFSIKVNITSLVSQKGLLRIYLGPKIMPGEHALRKNLFMLLDCFEINLKFGSNIVTRTSADLTDNSDDLLSLYTITKRITDAEFGLNSSIKLKSIEEQIKLPSRLIIPKGLPEGLPLQLFVFIVPFSKAVGGRFITTEINRDTVLSPGFPLDLDIEVQELFDLPNALVKDILVLHKDSDNQANSGRPGIKTWQNNDYHAFDEPAALPLAARPDFTLRKEPYDYKSKQGQYGKKDDYAAKRGDYKNKKEFNQLVDRSFTKNDIHKDYANQAHSERSDIKSWQNNDSQNFDESVVSLLTARPDFTLRKESYDYKSKQGKYGKKEEYAAKRGDYKYKKDFTQVVDRSFTKNDDKYINKPDITTNKNIMYIPDDMLSINKEKSEYIVTTDRSLDGGNSFFLDKKIEDKGNNEEFHVDITSNKKIVPDVITDDFNEVVHKVIVRNGTIETFDKTISDNNKDNFDILNKVNNKKIIDGTYDEKDLLNITIEDSDEDTRYSKEVIDISKTVPYSYQPYKSNKQFPTIYDVFINPLYDMNTPNDKLYE